MTGSLKASCIVALFAFGCSSVDGDESIATRRQAVDWQSKIPLGAGELGDGFGTDVAIDGNFVAAVAPTAPNGLTARVYEWTGSDFAERAQLTSSAASSGVDGGSVALRGAKLVVGDPSASPNGSGSGIAHVYERQGASWVPTGEVLPSQTDPFAHFGTSVAIDGDTAVVGAPDQDLEKPQMGCVFVFVHGGSGWTEQAVLKSDSGDYLDRFGIEIALMGDLLAIGANSSEQGTSSGSVHLYRRNGTTWAPEKHLTTPSFASYAYFGSSAVALAPGLLAVGASGAYGKAAGSGMVYLFEESKSWGPAGSLNGSDATFDSAFGTSLAISGDRILVGSVQPGAAYLFERPGGVWTETAKLEGDGDPNASFGLEVDLAPSAAIVGSPNTAQSLAGRAFVFGQPSPSAGTGGGAGTTGSGGQAGGVPSGGSDAGTSTGGSKAKPDGSDADESLYACGFSRRPALAWSALLGLIAIGAVLRRIRFRTERQTDRSSS